ncbi:MAG TPA: tripartite tricarboxylate transporter substrate binding protein [Casimicrobiaceae bacterium]|nr:tripartite tricarboxylate transporter substrate binding protein [Casimicrobiaceae bacterium]
MRISIQRWIAFVACTLCAPAIAMAQEAYPTRPVRIIVPFAAGGVADALPRIVGERLAQKWGQPVIVENKVGASGNIGMAEGARAAPDGYTLVLAPAGNLTVNPTLFPNLPFDTSRDLMPVTLLAQSPNVLVVHPSVPAKTFRELVAYAKANPGKLNFASPGDGSGAHLAAELFKSETGVDAVHVPYKGIAPAVNDLLGGNVQMMFAGISTVLQHIKSGKLVALAIASPKRNAELPSVPTVAESGLPGFDVTSWYGIVARAGTPSAIVQKLQRDMAEALQSEDTKAKLAGLGLEPVGNTAEAFDALIKSESRRWGDIVKKAGIKPQQ